MDRKYGYFSNNGKNYVITTPDIPRNWYNYLWNDRYITFTSQTGAGEGFLQDNMGKRIPLVKERGFYILEEDRAHGICGLPVTQRNDGFTCTHMMGATDVYTEKNQLASTVSTLVPRNFDGELWSVKVKNLSDTERSIRVIGFCGTDMDGSYQRQGYNTCTSAYDPDLNAIILERSASFEGKRQTQYAYMTLSETADAFDCTANAVIGSYGSVSHPLCVDRGGLSNSPCCGEKAAFAMEKRMTLTPNEETEIIFVVGVAFSRDRIRENRIHYASSQRFAIEKQKTTDAFMKETEQVSIQTPDEKLNHMFEWLKHQCNLGSRWARVRHNGYRDMTSDTDCLAGINPELALERFLRILTYQYPNGYAPRTFIDGKINDKNFSDNTVWLNFTAASIIKELGRPDILDIPVAYNDGSTGTVYEHLFRSVDFLYHFRGLHGLIRIWGGDWNDCMNTAGLNGKGVSVWLSIAWYRANATFTELAELYGKTDDANLARSRGEEIRDLIEEFGWDGEYYLDAYNDWDEKIGSHTCEEGKMFLLPQLWSVLSGVSRNGREIQAMDSVEKYLSSPLGTLISIPSYTKYNPRIGEVTAKPAGVQENGGVYLHTMAWKLAADALLGRADKVEEDIQIILPFRNPIVNGRAEPYTLCNCYFGEQTGYRYGTPGQSWRTASGQWFNKAMVNYVFGLMPEIEGLRISPCLPTSWKECSITKSFRGCNYHITYHNNGTRIEKILVNGAPINGTLLPLMEGDVRVTVYTEGRS